MKHKKDPKDPSAWENGWAIQGNDVLMSIQQRHPWCTLAILLPLPFVWLLSFNIIRLQPNYLSFLLPKKPSTKYFIWEFNIAHSASSSPSSFMVPSWFPFFFDHFAIQCSVHKLAESRRHWSKGVINKLNLCFLNRKTGKYGSMVFLFMECILI